MRRIGVLIPTAEDDQDSKVRIAAFVKEMQQFGWTDGRNVRIDYRFVAAKPENYPKYAAELVALAPDVILAPYLAWSSSRGHSARRLSNRSLALQTSLLMSAFDPKRISEDDAAGLAALGSSMLLFGLGSVVGVAKYASELRSERQNGRGNRRGKGHRQSYHRSIGKLWGASPRMGPQSDRTQQRGIYKSRCYRAEPDSECD